MPGKDLREFIEKLKQVNDARTIKSEVDWNLEAAAIMRRSNEIGGPVTVFENIKDCPGYRLAGGITAQFSRIAIALDMEPTASYTEILDEYIKRRKALIKPMVVTDGKCKENIILGNDVDLSKIPAPMIHPDDGGRYLGTLYVGVCKDLDSDWMNWGTYRMMVSDEKTACVWLNPFNHGGIIHKKYEDNNKPMQYAAVFGVNPLMNLVAGAGVPYGVNEVDVAGGLMQEPVELIKCETNDLYVPADAELIIEGEILPHERKTEGPFGEGPAYLVPGDANPRPFINVTAITHRNNAIIPVNSLGIPPDEAITVECIAWGADIKIALLDEGIPITGVYIPPESSLYSLVVGVKNTYFGIPQRVANCVWGNRNGQFIPKIFVVDDDIDPTNMDEVIHAFSVKCNPIRGIRIDEGAFSCPLTPYLPVGLKDKGMGGGNVLFDCTWPKEWKEENIPIKCAFSGYPKDIQEKVKSRWHKDYELD